MADDVSCGYVRLLQGELTTPPVGNLSPTKIRQFLFEFFGIDETTFLR